MSVYAGTPTDNGSWVQGDRNGKRIRIVRNLTLTISSQGGATNTIGYAALGFASGGIQSVVPVNYTDGAAQNRAIFAWTDGSSILLGDPQVSTGTDRGEPLDMSGTLQIEVAGLAA